MTETQILKAPKSAANKPKPAGETGAKTPKPERTWPDVFELEEARTAFSPVEDPIALEAFYRLWRMAQGHQADANEIAACSKLIEHRIGRAYQKSPLGASSLEGVEISYRDPSEDEEETGAENSDV